MDNQNRIWARVKRRDRLARWFIAFGGVAIIIGMLTMIIFIISVALPLFSSPKKELLNNFSSPIPASQIRFFEMGPFHEHLIILDRDGILTAHGIKRELEAESRFRITPTGVESLAPSAAAGGAAPNLASETPSVTSEPALPTEPTSPDPLVAPTVIRAAKSDLNRLEVQWSDRTVALYDLHYKPVFSPETGRRTIETTLEFVSGVQAANVEPESPGMFRADEDGRSLLIRQRADGNFWFSLQTREEDFMGEVSVESKEAEWNPGISEKITAFTVPKSANRLYAGTDRGNLYAWNLESIEAPVLIAQVSSNENASPITEICLMLGEVSIVVGDASGKISTWNLINGEPPQLVRLHQMPGHQQPIRRLYSSFRNKSLVSLDDSGNVKLSYMTSERLLLDFPARVPVNEISYSERGDSLTVLDSQDKIWLYAIDSPHPEISWKVLWGEVWYEGYREPDHVWQSSAGTDDFESKMSLAPLLYGSLKGTFYGLLFSLPLALLGAMYVSHLMDPRFRVFIKPVIELMAAIPSVVVGFLAALWLAGRLEHNLFAVVFSLVTIPLVVALGMFQLFKRKSKVNGREFLWALPLILIAFLAAYQMGAFVQQQFFDDHFNLWLFQVLGMQVDQRNCIVISFALGFAVIPVIFTISEDALYNVPKHLTAAALALGSSRWQTLRHVVLPMASPGIFAAVMIGFGRAVGETMIVLMATGNTPIMSASIFNGMRTLSANIAVEIPEAPVDSTLYRVLFLSAALLFMLTFCVNTLAELVRNRLRKKYKNL